MSHVEDVVLAVKDLQVLARACEAIGVKFVEGQKTYNWWGRSVGDYRLPKGFTEKDLGKCEHAIVVPPENPLYHKYKGHHGVKGNEPFEVGIVKAKDDEGYHFLFDFYSGGYGIVEALGGSVVETSKDPASAFNKLMQEYGLIVAEQEALVYINEGWQMERVHEQNGDIKLRVFC